MYYLPLAEGDDVRPVLGGGEGSDIDNVGLGLAKWINEGPLVKSDDDSTDNFLHGVAGAPDTFRRTPHNGIHI